MSDQADLLFFDTFSHESSEELNLDLVQFPKSVFVSEIRIIPLGARVQGDFPGGVRLGATNPTQFHIDFFVNDLSKPGASTFEALGSLDYCQNGEIHMECASAQEQPRIPTDGLVLRGWYTTITLAVYGNLTQVIPDSPVGQNQPQNVQRPSLPREVGSIAPTAVPPPQDWNQEVVSPIPAYTGNMATPNPPEIYGPPDSYPPDNYDNQIYRPDYYEGEPPKDPRAYHHTEDNEGTLWDKERGGLSCEREPDRLRHSPSKDLERDRLCRPVDLDRDRRDGRSRLRSRSLDRDRGRSRESSRHRDRSRELDRIDRIHSRSRSHERDYVPKGDYRPMSRSRSRSIEGRERLRTLSGDRDWDRTSYKKDEYRRHRDTSYDRSRAGSYDKRSTSYERRGSPYDKRGPSYERKLSYEKRAPSYEKRTPTYEKRLSPYDKRASSYERRAPSYEKQPLPYDKRGSYEKRHSPYNRVRDSNYGSRSPSRDEIRKRPRTPPVDVPRRPVTPARENNNGSPINSAVSDEGPVEYDHSGKIIPRAEYYQGYRHKKPIRSPSQEMPASTKNPNYIESQHSSLLTVKIVDNIASPPKQASIESPTQVQEEDRSMDAEPFEPILSDEDICDDLEGPPYMDVDYDVNEYCGVEDIIKYYNPFKAEWVQYENINKPQMLAWREADNKKHVMNAIFSELCEASPDLLSLLELTKAGKKREQKFFANTFSDLENSAKEDWVHQCEQLSVLVTSLCKHSDIILCIVRNYGKDDIITDEFIDIFNFLVTFCRIGLNFDFALSQVQPTYKIRHMKCGIRLVEALLSHRHNGHVMKVLLSLGINVPVSLLEMYCKEYMALSIRLMILKALDGCLLSKESMKHFLQEAVYPKLSKSEQADDKKIMKNGYQVLISIMRTNPLARIKFSINALIKKINTYELLERLHDTVLNINHLPLEKKQTEESELSECDTDFIIDSLEEIMHMFKSDSFDISQPKRFLPVTAQFDINKDCSNESLLEFFTAHNFLEVCLYLLTCPTTCNVLIITSPIHNLLHELVHSREGLHFLYRNMESCELLFKSLLQPYGQQIADEFIFPHDLTSYSDLQILGFEMAYRLKSLYYLESLGDLQAGQADENELIDRLQSLYCLSFGTIGKLSVMDVVVMGDNVECLMNVFEQDARPKGKNDTIIKLKSPSKSYAIDIVASAVKFSADLPFLKKYGQRILNVAIEHERFEPSVSSLLQEVIPYLKVLEKPGMLTGEDIAECVEIVKSCIEHVTNLPGELITCLRILKHFCVSEYASRSSVCESQSEEYIELKYRYNVLQLFSLEGVAHLSAVLDSLSTHFDQPGMHTSTFASVRGLLIAQIMLPCLKLLDPMLARVVRSRGSRFRDLTAAPVLLRAYGVVRTFPPGSLGYKTASMAAETAVRALLAYAQPAADDACDGDSIRRGPWTSLCTEVISYTMSAPHTFVPGLLAFSELLPLPLPMQTRTAPTARELADAANERRLWSAHMHALSTDLTDMIQTICVSAYRPVVHMLRRVCVQIADLAPNTATIVARAAVGAVVREMVPGKPATATAARVVGFLACLVAHAPVKCAILHAMAGSGQRAGEMSSALTNILQTMHVAPEHAAAQEFAAHTLCGLCDAEVTLTPSSASPETILANSLPNKDILSALLDVTVQCLSSPTRTCTVATSILRVFFVVTEHDYGFQQFRRLISKRKESFASFFRWTAESASDERTECLSIYLELMKILRSEEGALGRRTMLALPELADLVGYSPSDPDHIALTLENVMKERSCEDDVIANAAFLSSSLLKLKDTELEYPAIQDSAFPAPETLVALFSSRPIHTAGLPDDERLTASYWLNTPPSSADDDDAELVPCDIAELANIELCSSGGAESLLASVRKLLGAACVVGGRERAVLTATSRDKRPFVTPARARVETATCGDTFRSRPPNTSRPPSLHVDDFTALEVCGAQPTGPTGYNKPQGRGMRRGGITIADRGRFASATPQHSHYRQLRGRGAWEVGGQHFGPFAPAGQYMMGGMGWGNARMQRGHRHRAFMR